MSIFYKLHQGYAPGQGDCYVKPPLPGTRPTHLLGSLPRGQVGRRMGRNNKATRRGT